MTDNWSKWHSSGDISLISIYMMNFISWLGSSAVSLYKGKRPRSQPLRWSCTIENGSHQMDLFLSGRGVFTLTQEWLEWQFIDRFADHCMIDDDFCLSGGYLVKWHPSDEETMKWNMDFISRVGSSDVSLYKGKRPRSQPLRWMWKFSKGVPLLSWIVSLDGF